MKIKFDNNKIHLYLFGLLLVSFIVVSFIAFSIFVYQYLPRSFSTNLLDSTSTSEEFIVTRVTDGDTIEVTKNNVTYKVRYIGVDTPETVKPNTPVQCFGKEASNFNSQLVLNKKVKLESDTGDEDRYGRKLRYVYLAEGENNGKMVNEILISEGYATIETVPPNVKFSEKFKLEEMAARENNKGLWNQCK